MAGLQSLAEKLAKKGRYGDTMLLHVNPVEVAGLDALAKEMYGMGLTKNPDTGQPEAFLPFLAPLMTAMATPAGMALTGAGVGALTNRDDPMRGALMGGLTGGLGGAALGGMGLLGQTGAQAAGAGAQQAATQAATQTAADTAAKTALQKGMEQGLNMGAATPPTTGLASSTTANLTPMQAPVTSMTPMPGPATTPMQPMGGSIGSAPVGGFNAPTPPPGLASSPSAPVTGGAGVQPPAKPGFFEGMLNDPGKMIQMGLLGSMAENYLRSGDKGEDEAAARKERKKYEDRIRDNYAQAGRPMPFNFAMGGGVRGPGDGMSDSIPAMINGRQPAELSDGEFVFPADVVSAIGRGSTDAGVRRLEEMMGNIRANRDKLLGKKSQ